MYNFIDTTELCEGNILPSEALCFNGEYIENLIPGYRTLYIKGREALSPEIDAYETGVRDGSMIRNKRYPARIITVGYQIKAATNEAFRMAYNQLGGILNVDEAELIFNDEQDVFFIGTPCNIGEVEPGRNVVNGEFDILCVDPFKYSVYEYEAEAFEDSLLLDYKGTYKAYPILEADFFNENEVSDDGTAGTLTGNGDCGFVAFFTEDEKIIQLGDPDEKDVQSGFAKSQTMANQQFMASSSWGTAAKALWALNSGNTLPSDVQKLGSLAMNVASWNKAAAPKDTSGTIYSGKSDAGAPSFNYKIVAKATNRTSTSVKITLTITTSLAKDANYFGRPYALKGSVYFGGSWRTFTIKKSTEYWKGKTAHTVNISFTLSNLTASTSSLTGIKFKVERTDTTGGNAGILSEKSCKNLAISTWQEDTPETYYLSPSSYGSYANKWHGPCMTKTIGADAAGVVGAKDFTLTYKQKMCISATNQLGAFEAMICDNANKNIAGVRINKGSAGNSANMMFYVNNAQVYSTTIDMSYNNANFGSKETAVKTSTITKSGSTITFNVAGIVKTFTNSTIANLVATKITYSFEQYSTYAVLAYNGLYWSKFVKNNCDTFKDIPNKFTANDVVEVDCKNGEIRLNGVLTPGLGALGNDFETFVLTPGLNQIGVACSEWVSDAYKPTYKVRYREVFL